ncbi:hypothetical protein M2281_005778 [Mesorhizobium soli]|uniref:hypothetical protein n=1 Tax=Pseudaminobacter soli (ex Li et al. 2025) TaxID=1295366 RepID=UPI0024760FDD|nr:hypothetical protein [Mesorhizobium soli]MDH6235156.1 hypothetical protein [Mesorhizobium soli]
MDVLDKVINLIAKPKSSVAELEAALSRFNIDELESAADKLEADRRRILLNGSDRELEDIESKITGANRKIERALAAKDELEKRLREAAAAEADSVRLARYRAAKKAGELAAARAADEYPRHAAAIVELIRALAEATAAVELANGDLPAGQDPLPDPEFAARGKAGLPQKIVSEEEVDRWYNINQCGIAPEALWSKLDRMDHGRTGVVNDAGFGCVFEKRRFIRREYLEAEMMVRPDRLAGINLPGFAGDDGPIWRAVTPSNDVRTILARLSAVAQHIPVSREDRREVRVEFIPVEDEVVDAPVPGDVEEQAA